MPSLIFKIKFDLFLINIITLGLCSFKYKFWGGEEYKGDP